MKYISKNKKEKIDKTFEFELKSPNSANYSLSVLIKKEVTNLLQLNAGDKLEIHIEEDENGICYELGFKYKDESKNRTISLDEAEAKEI